MDIVNYTGQIIYVKTTDDAILLLKVIGNSINQHKSFKLKVLEKNGEIIDEDRVIYSEEITRICILPSEMQQGIELTLSHEPTFTFFDKKLLSHAEIGER